jgi:hypothetical protein
MAELNYLVEGFVTKDAPLWFHTRGLSETASGYGGRLRSTKMLRINGEKVWRRVYVMCYSNSGTAYVNVKGEKWIVRNID